MLHMLCVVTCNANYLVTHNMISVFKSSIICLYYILSVIMMIIKHFFNMYNFHFYLFKDTKRPDVIRESRNYVRKTHFYYISTDIWSHFQRYIYYKLIKCLIAFLFHLTRSHVSLLNSVTCYVRASLKHISTRLDFNKIWSEIYMAQCHFDLLVALQWIPTLGHCELGINAKI